MCWKCGKSPIRPPPNEHDMKSRMNDLNVIIDKLNNVDKMDTEKSAEYTTGSEKEELFGL